MNVPLSPNIVLFHVDNLGMGELGCYGGGIIRGAPTRRIDAFASEGMQLWHYIAEPQCTPSRSALMTGRHAIRSGTGAVPAVGEPGGLVSWEKTLADVLSADGYSTACFGKWHLGDEAGRWPTDHGFDHFYGPPGSYTEALWPEDPWYDPRRDPVCYMHEGSRSGGVRPLTDEQLTLSVRKNVDLEYSKRAITFMHDAVSTSQPFLLYYNHSMMHMPTIPRDSFRGSTGHGDWADCLAELDHDFGEILDTIDSLDVTDNTIVVLVGDNGPEEKALWRGSAGVFDGSYFTGSEGGLRTPCLVRWPGKVPPRGISNGMFHQVDLFTTLLLWVGCAIPADRMIDGLDQRSFLEGKSGTAREGCLVWVRDRIHSVKWRDFKVVYIRQQYESDGIEILNKRQIVNLVVDPKEREAVNLPHLHTWVDFHTNRLLKDFDETCSLEELIPPSSDVNFVPRSELNNNL